MSKEETEKKYISRKFIVWITATVYLAGTLVYAFITKDSTLAQQFTPWWGGITMVYIGGNVAQKFASPKVETPQDQEVEC